jgi:RNA polymerase sigma-70 factor, ECF subfamily
LKGIVANDACNKLSRDLERIFEQHGDLVFRTAYALTGSTADAEDIVQTIFMRLLASEVPPDLSTAPERYLYRAAFNLSLNAIRKKKREVLTGDIEKIDKRSTAGPGTTEEIFDRRLHDAITRLNPAAAQILILRYVHDYSLAAIAKMLGTTHGTVAVSLFRSRLRLKRILSASDE